MQGYNPASFGERRLGGLQLHVLCDRPKSLKKALSVNDACFDAG